MQMKIASVCRGMPRIVGVCLAVPVVSLAGWPTDLARSGNDCGGCSTVQSPTPPSIAAGQKSTVSVYYTCYTPAAQKVTDTLAIGLLKLPKGMTFTPTTTSANQQTNITISTTSETPPGTYNVIVGGQGDNCDYFNQNVAGCGGPSLACGASGNGNWTLTVTGPQKPPPKISCAESSHQVCPSLWWFNGVTPQPGFYLTKLQATPAGESDYSWEISDGTQYAQFSNNSSTIDTKGTNSVEILPKGGPGNDTPVPTVSVTVTVKTKDGTSTSAPFSLNVRKPYELLARQGPCKAPACDHDNARGYNSHIYYKIVDQEGTPLPQPVQLNEHFNDDLSNDYPGNNWDQPPNCGPSLYCEAFFPPTGWDDSISVHNQSLTPAPQNPGPLQKPPKPLGTTRVDHWSGTWSIGDGTPGKGITVQMNTWQRFQDHGRHYNIVSPLQ